MPPLMSTLRRIVRHRLRDEPDVHRAVPPAMVERLMRRVAASEQRHTGQVRICVEAGLPTSYLWRGATARERAVTLFGKLRVWDTEQNNGVLIYLLLAEHAIEIVADRGLNRHVDTVQWQQLVAHMGDALGADRYEDGLTLALEEISALLVEYFPAAPGDASALAPTEAAGEGLPPDPLAHASAGPRPNELPDAPVLGGDPLLKE